MSEKRIEIMDAAERRIRTAGYNGFSFRDIAADVGVKSSSIHYYFPTKEDLGVAVARRYTDRFFEGLRDASGSPEKHLSAAYDKAMESDGQMCLCGVLGTASKSLPEQVAVEAKRFFQCALKFLLTTRKSASRKEQDWALQILALLEGAMMLALALGDADAFRRATRSLPAKPQ
jgi:TetR/AcrR family transcriptional repressor of nem operon